jgi:TM2 domain-containing membrane protein YozV
MVDAITVAVLAIAVVALVFARQILGSLKMLAANAVGGVLTIMVASWFGFGVALTPMTLLITALAGVPGAILVLLLAYGGVAFVPPGAGEAGNILVEQASQNLDRLLSGFGEFVEFVNESSSSSNGTAVPPTERP